MDNLRKGNGVGGQAALTVGLALVLSACTAKTPALTLVFRGLPAEAGWPKVTLEADGWGFEGMDLIGGPISVLHERGRLVILIERAYLATHDDRLRLELRVPRTLELRGVASVPVSGQSWAATANATAVPGQDLGLSFAFGEIDPEDAAIPPDGPSADAAPTLLPLDAGRDTALPGELSARDLAGTDVAAPDAGPSDVTPPDGAAPVASCTSAPLKPASVALASTEPSMAFTGSSYAIAWSELGGARIFFNAVDRTGTLQHPDITLVPSEATQPYRSPRLVFDGGTLAVAYGHSKGSGNSAGVSMRLIQPATGAAGPPVLLAQATADDAAPELGGLTFAHEVANPYVLALVSRTATSMASPARVSLLTRDLVPVAAQNPAALAATRATGITWAAGPMRFAVAAIVDGSAGGGTITTFGADLSLDRSFAFTSAPAAPVINTAGATVSVAGAGQKLAVAWIDGQSCAACLSPKEVHLALVDAGTGAILQRTHVSATGATVPKIFPHVAHDGASYAVAWEEYASPAVSRVMFRRFDETLRPIGEALDLSAGAPARPVGDIDLVVEARNTYGLVMTPHLGRHHFTRIVCTGP